MGYLGPGGQVLVENLGAARFLLDIIIQENPRVHGILIQNSLPLAHGASQRARSRAVQTSSNTLTRACRLSFPATRVQGAICVLVRSTMSFTARS